MIDGAPTLPGAEVDRRGQPHAGSDDRGGLLAELVQQLTEELLGLVHAVDGGEVRLELDAALGEDLVGPVGDHHGEVAVPVVDAEQQACGAGEPDDLAATHLGDLHEPARQQLPHDVRHRGGREAGAPRQPGLRDLPVLGEQLEHPQPVGAAQGRL